MATMELDPAAIGALSDKELEILRLLATGHTAKSIAMRLGKSEAAVNERLRDARRKTGVASSRELARLLAARKIWDRKFDLSQVATNGEAPSRPHDTGRKGKGAYTMLIAVPLAAAALLVATSGSLTNGADQTATQAAAAEASPLVGRWSLDTSRIPADERPRQVTIDFRHSAAGLWTTHVEIVAADGATMQADSTAATDGVPVQVTGNIPSINTGSLRQPKPDTLVMTLGRDGTPVSTRVYTVSADGQSMTETIIWAGETTPRMVPTYFTRVG